MLQIAICDNEESCQKVLQTLIPQLPFPTECQCFYDGKSLLAANYFFISLVENITRTQVAQREQELAFLALEQESARYQQFLKQHSETDRTMHDIRNQLAVGIGLLQDGQTEEACRIIEQLAIATRGSSGGGITGNAAIDPFWMPSMTR